MIKEEDLLLKLAQVIGNADKAKEALDVLKGANMDTPITDLKLSEEVKKGILDVLIGGQSYKIGNRFLERAKLGDLIRLQNELEAKQSDSNNDLFGNTVAAYFGGR